MDNSLQGMGDSEKETPSHFCYMGNGELQNFEELLQTQCLEVVKAFLPFCSSDVIIW